MVCVDTRSIHGIADHCWGINPNRKEGRQMKKYNGAILDEEGFIMFEFTTGFCWDYEKAIAQAKAILNAWRSTHPAGEFFYTLEDDAE